MHDLPKYEESAADGDRAAGAHRDGRKKVPVFMKVLAAVACLGLLLLGVLGSPNRPLSQSPEVVGEREMVRITWADRTDFRSPRPDRHRCVGVVTGHGSGEGSRVRPRRRAQDHCGFGARP